MTSLIKSVTFNSTNNPGYKLDFTVTQPIYISNGYAISQFTTVNTIYNIDSRNNQFSFIESDTPSIIRTFVIPPGNYTVTSYMSAVSTLLNSSGTDVYTVANNTLTNIITISGTSKTFKIVSVLNDTYYESGFKISSNFSLTQTGSQSFDLSGLKIINIGSNSFGIGGNILVNSNINILCSVPVIAPYQGVIIYNPPIAFISSQINEISSVNLVLYDERLRPLTLQNDFSLTILLSQ